MAKKNVWKRWFPAALLAAVSAAVGITGAVVVHNLTLENPIKTPPVEGTIKEELSGTSKKAAFKNTGEADVFLRVAYTETWTYTDAEGEHILPNYAKKTGSTETYRVASPEWVNTDRWQLDPGSGWLYYYKALPVGETTELIVDQVDFAGTGSNPEVSLNELVDGDKYREAEYDLHFTLEVVQASDDVQVSRDAIAALFGEDKSSSIRDNWTKASEITWSGTEEWSPDSQNGSGS